MTLALGVPGRPSPRCRNASLAASALSVKEADNTAPLEPTLALQDGSRGLPGETQCGRPEDSYKKDNNIHDT